MGNQLEPKQIAQILVEQKIKSEKIFAQTDPVIIQSLFKSWLQSTGNLLEELIGEDHSATKDFLRYIRTTPEKCFNIDDESANSKFFLIPQTIIDSVIDEYFNKQKIQDQYLKNTTNVEDSESPSQENIQKKYRIFISHINEDKDLAISFQELLKSIFDEKIDVFVSSDDKSIEFGTDWFNEIIQSLKECDMAIIFCNKRSIARPWISFESGAAYIRDIPTIPLCCDDISASELPGPFDHIHAANALNSDHIERIFKFIAKKVNFKLPQLEIEKTAFLSKVYASSDRARHGAVTIVVSGEQSYERGEQIKFSGTSTVKVSFVDMIIFKYGQSWPPVFKKRIKVNPDCSYEISFDSRILDSGIYTAVVEGLNDSSGTVSLIIK